MRKFIYQDKWWRHKDDPQNEDGLIYEALASNGFTYRVIKDGNKWLSADANSGLLFMVFAGVTFEFVTPEKPVQERIETYKTFQELFSYHLLEEWKSGVNS